MAITTGGACAGHDRATQFRKAMTYGEAISGYPYGRWRSWYEDGSFVPTFALADADAVNRLGRALASRVHEAAARRADEALSAAGLGGRRKRARHAPYMCWRRPATTG